MNRVKYSALLLILLSTGMISCEKFIPPTPAEDELLDGPTTGLNNSEQRRFLSGDIAFNDDVFTTASGLGPGFVATSCGSCHAGDGKGHPFTTLVRFGQTLPDVLPDLSIGGPQLQSRAIPGWQPEILPNGAPSMKLTPPAVTGLGFLSALTDAQILQNEDPDDLDADGISGRANYVNPPTYFVPQWFHEENNGKYIGRFGKKAAVVDLLQQTVGAYNQDMGVLSTFEPTDPLTKLPGDPEVSDEVVNDVVFYLRTLKAPIQRSVGDPEIEAGRQVFSDINCASCHIPEWTTPQSDIEALSNVTIYPYTDLLLHDMGPGLDDGVTEGGAETFEWRTPPLWGLGLSPNSQGGEFFLMHDGKAGSIEESILLHGGEAQDSRDKYNALSEEDKQRLLKFLNSL